MWLGARREPAVVVGVDDFHHQRADVVFVDSGAAPRADQLLSDRANETQKGFGGDVARLLAAGHGGQILLSQATVDRVQGALPAGVTLRDMGWHHLRDIPHPERLFQVLIPGLPTEFPPPRTPAPPLQHLPVAATPLGSLRYVALEVVEGLGAIVKRVEASDRSLADQPS